jgi:glycosyltransferase involved in cell wall biosynthesis
MDAVTAGLAGRLISRSTRIVVLDFLLPPTTPRWLLRIALRRIDEFVVIRSGDTEILARLGVPTDRCRFVAFAAQANLAHHSAGIGEYVYSGGTAQRDWATLADALGQSGVAALVSCPDEEQPFTANVLKLPLVGPAQGRKYLSGSRFLVQAIVDNEQPSGPLLILDAFSAGKPVVASDVNGTRDYIEDDVNGVLVQPHNPAALAEAISALYSDVDRVARMADAARRTATELSSTRFWGEALAPYVGAGESSKETVPD